jgi:uncharacterized protein YndB with AHSA1/START domain
MTSTETVPAERATTVQVSRVFIKAPAERIWQAITDPGWNGRYGYGAVADYDLSPGGDYRCYASEEMKRGSVEMGYPEPPDVIADGEVVLADPPYRLVQTWRMLMDPACGAEGFSRLSYDIAGPGPDGVCRLTVTHELGGMPATAALVRGSEELGAPGGGGWDWILSDLKTLLETGEAFSQPGV